MNVSREALCGYILEEVLAYLIRNTGYRLLIDEYQDPDELCWERNGLAVKGRGAVHQVDVLGELIWVPAFTFPLRLFVEAKFRREKTGISVVRNAVGAMTDINQNNLPRSTRGNPIELHAKYHYVGAIFSTSGFSRPAMDMALAHGVSLVDVGIPEFSDLLAGISDTAEAIYRNLNVNLSCNDIDLARGKLIFGLRSALRRALGTNPHINYEDRPFYKQPDEALVKIFTSLLQPSVSAATEVSELFVGMGQGPYMLVLSADNPDHFLAYATEYPSHNVSITWSPDDTNGRIWYIQPQDDFSRYQLRFKLPDPIGDWIFSEKNVLRAAMNAKQKFFSNITIYRHHHARDQLIRLNFKPTEIGRRTD